MFQTAELVCSKFETGGDLARAPPFDPSDILLQETWHAAVFLDAVHLVLQDRDAVLACNASKPKGDREDERDF